MHHYRKSLHKILRGSSFRPSRRQNALNSLYFLSCQDTRPLQTHVDQCEQMLIVKNYVNHGENLPTSSLKSMPNGAAILYSLQPTVHYFVSWIWTTLDCKEKQTGQRDGLKWEAAHRRLEKTGSRTFGWDTDHRDFPRNWSLRHKCYDTSIIFFLEFYTFVMSTTGRQLQKRPCQNTQWAESWCSRGFSSCMVLDKRWEGLPCLRFPRLLVAKNPTFCPIAYPVFRLCWWASFLRPSVSSSAASSPVSPRLYRLSFWLQASKICIPSGQGSGFSRFGIAPPCLVSLWVQFMGPI